MICKICGKECPEGSKYCPNCGAKIVEDVIEASIDDETNSQPETDTTNKSAKVWSVFAKIGFIFGIVAISICLIPYSIHLQFGILGIVFSCLGKKSNDEDLLKKCKTGLILSIIGLSISFVIFLLTYSSSSLSYIFSELFEDIFSNLV